MQGSVTSSTGRRTDTPAGRCTKQLDAWAPTRLGPATRPPPAGPDLELEALILHARYGGRGAAGDACHDP
jgi:hypothetical protein